MQFFWGQRTYIMGAINLTPDSFSGDGVACDIEMALETAISMVEQGADIIDLGGESTRPGATAVSLDEELRRVIPAVEYIAGRVGVPISIDTYKGEVARQALESGASIINDVWGLKKDISLARLAKDYSASIILMHNQHGVDYRDLVSDVMSGLMESVELALQCGVQRDSIILDPGIGFGKTAEHNLELLRRLDWLKDLGFPLLVGTSRKSTIGLVLDLPVDQRLEGTAATVALAIAKGADIVRVHDVRQMSKVVRMSDAIVRGWRQTQ
jgi:dihydropteroate synthase